MFQIFGLIMNCQHVSLRVSIDFFPHGNKNPFGSNRLLPHINISLFLNLFFPAERSAICPPLFGLCASF